MGLTTLNSPPHEEGAAVRIPARGLLILVGTLALSAMTWAVADHVLLKDNVRRIDTLQQRSMQDTADHETRIRTLEEVARDEHQQTELLKQVKEQLDRVERQRRTR